MGVWRCAATGSLWRRNKLLGVKVPPGPTGCNHGPAERHPEDPDEWDVDILMDFDWSVTSKPVGLRGVRAAPSSGNQVSWVRAGMGEIERSHFLELISAIPPRTELAHFNQRWYPLSPLSMWWLCFYRPPSTAFFTSWCFHYTKQWMLMSPASDTRLPIFLTKVSASMIFAAKMNSCNSSIWHGWYFQGS